MSNWTHWIVDTRTGVKQLQVFPSAGSWSRKLNSSGSGAHTFQLGGPTVITRAVWQGLTVTTDRTLVVSRITSSGVEVARYAGLIERVAYNRDTRELTLNTADIRDILMRRYPFGVGTYAGGTFTCTSLSWRAIAATAVSRGLTGPRVNYSLPIILPSTSEAGTNTKTYYNYNFTNVYDLLNEIQKLGPDIDFEPSWSAGVLVWTMRAGSDAVPSLTGGSFEWNLSSPQPALIGVTVAKDGTKQANGIFSVGSGSGSDMAVGGTGLAGTGAALDVVQPHKLEDSAARLAAYSTAALTTFNNPTVQWSLGILASDKMMPIESAQLGSALRLLLSGDPYLADGVTSVRLIGYSGDLTESIKLDIQ